VAAAYRVRSRIPGTELTPAVRDRPSEGHRSNTARQTVRLLVRLPTETRRFNRYAIRLKARYVLIPTS